MQSYQHQSQLFAKMMEKLNHNISCIFYYVLHKGFSELEVLFW